MRVRTLIFAALACLSMGLPAAALDLDDVVTARALSGAPQSDGTHIAGLDIRLAPGWKTYWRQPGEGGIPPRFNWAGSENVGAVEPHWPVPYVSWQNGLRSIGYEGRVVIPLRIRPTRSGAPMRLAGEIEIGVCEEICIPVTLRVDTELGGGDTLAPAISAALSDRPMRPAEANVSGVVCQITPISDGMRVVYSVSMPPLGAREDSAIEFEDPSVWITEPVSKRDGGRLQVSAELIAPSNAPFSIARQDLRLTVFGDAGAVDIQGCSAG
ncbi:MAG: protein-disulfide reductase DsbD domain-containing protein [Pseudomonadota bacterium]